jgi:nitroimidazol reductase NimA-like FMN-containing flavoprotein (pyridoxamine 5'-phosphate oxidase superfamily)
MSSSSDPPGPTLEELSREECLQLVGTQSIGRVAVARRDEPPLVVPVNYVLDGEIVVFRSDPGTKLFALREQPISFQVDSLDPYHRTGWSVLLAGVAYEATPLEVEHLTVEPWTGGDKQHWVRVIPQAVSGRRIRLPEIKSSGHGYL